MSIKEKRARSIKLINKYAPKGTKIYWNKSRARCACRYKYCEHLDEFYDYEIAINIYLAQKLEWAELQKYVIQAIAHTRLPGHKHDNYWLLECNLLMALIKEEEKAKEAVEAAAA